MSLTARLRSPLFRGTTRLTPIFVKFLGDLPAEISDLDMVRSL